MYVNVLVNAFFKLLNCAVLIGVGYYLYRKYVKTQVEEKISEKEALFKGLEEQGYFLEGRFHALEERKNQEIIKIDNLKRKVEDWAAWVKTEQEKKKKEFEQYRGAALQALKIKNGYLENQKRLALILPQALEGAKKILQKDFAQTSDGQNYVHTIVEKLKKGADMKAEGILARRYAQAFLNLFELNDAELATIQQAVDFLSAHKEIESLLKVPVIKTALKVEALDEHVLKKFNVPDVCKQLVWLLADQARISLVRAVFKQIISLYQEQHAIEPFMVKSSYALSTDDSAFIQKFLAAQTHARVPCTFVVDQELIGGIRMQSTEHIWEYSIAKQLKQLQASLQH